jgi:flagellar assembly factor FliW
MKVETTRFGPIEIDEEKVFLFEKGILGFPEDQRYALLPHSENSPFFWLQSLDSPDLAFVVINPALIVEDYSFEIPDEMERELELEESSQAEVLVLVTFRQGNGEKPLHLSANLLGPLIINVKNRRACQAVLDPKKYPVRFEFS